MRIAAAVVALGLCAAPSAFAQDAPAEPAPRIPAVIQAGDTSLTCAAISDEAARLSEAMGGEPAGSLFSRLGGVARAGAAMVIPGAGLALAGADALTAPERERKEAEAAAVQHRWYYLNGLYAGRDCQAASDAAGPLRPRQRTPPRRSCRGRRNRPSPNGRGFEPPGAKRSARRKGEG